MTGRPDPPGVLRPDFAFVDVESSSLFPGYPVEVGWADDGLTSDSFLLRPSPTWNPADWSGEAERMHGLSRERLLDEGVEAYEATRRLDEAFAGKRLLASDNADYDAKWIAMVYAAARRPMTFEVVPFELSLPFHVALDRANLADWERRFARAHLVAERAFPHPHRAAADAVRLAATFRLAVDDAFMDAVARWKLDEGLDDAGEVQLGLPFRRV